MEKQVSKSQFKAHALEIMRDVEHSGEAVVITARGKPTLIVKQFTENKTPPLQKLKGAVVSYDSPFCPISEDDWELA